MKQDIAFFVINMDKDAARLQKFTEQTRRQGLHFERHVGPLVQEREVSFSGKRYSVRAKGYVGVALAHLTLWEKIAGFEDDRLLCNVLEDDEMLRDNYESNIMAEVQKIPGDIDFFNLNVIRPLGSRVAPDILRIGPQGPGRKTHNIWLSNYIMTPQGAQIILSLLLKDVKNLNTNFDRTFVRLLHKHSALIKAYVLEPQDKHSIHDEAESSKKEMNSKHILYRMVAAFRRMRMATANARGPIP